MKYKDIELTDGEKKIVKALKRLEKLWENHGDRLILMNGNSLRIIDDSGYFQENEILSLRINGDGGDSGMSEPEIDMAGWGLV